MGKRTGLDPSVMGFLIDFETDGSNDPSQKGGTSGAMGLIQFMPKIARELGTSTAELAKMTRAEQLRYVEKYMAQKRSGYKKSEYNGLSASQAIKRAGSGLTDTYLGIFSPANIGVGNQATIYSGNQVRVKDENAKGGFRYIQARDFDRNKNAKGQMVGDGIIQKWEIAEALTARANQRGFSNNGNAPSGEIKVNVDVTGNVTVSGTKGPGDAQIQQGAKLIAQGAGLNAANGPAGNARGSR